MAACHLEVVRNDADYLVMTQHPDYIRPHDLSQSLAHTYGDKKFKISLRRNIYVIYVVKSTDVSSLQDPPYNQRLQDTNKAEEVLKRARVRKSLER